MTTEVKTVSTVEQTPQEPLKNQSKQSDKDITVFSGMTADDVVQNGSDAQKLVAEWFANWKKEDGIFDKKEAELLNSYTFTLDEDKKEFTAKSRGCNITIKYNNLDEIKNGMEKYVINSTFEKGTVVFDLRNETAVYEDIQNFDGIECPNKGVKTITIRNASTRGILAEDFHGALKLEGVADHHIWTSKTSVWVEKDATLSADEECKLNIYRIEK